MSYAPRIRETPKKEKKKDSFKSSKLGCWPLPNWNFTVTLDKVCLGKRKRKKERVLILSAIMGDIGRMIRIISTCRVE